MSDFELKWKPKDISQAVILSFGQEWSVPINERGFSVVFRKRWPSQRDPQVIYAYIGSPVCQIAARMPIAKWSSEPIESALKYAKRGMLSPDELLKYVGTLDRVFVIKIKEIELAPNPISLQRLSSEYGFFPSPSAVSLSAQGERVLSELCGF